MCVLGGWNGDGRGGAGIGADNFWAAADAALIQVLKDRQSADRAYAQLIALSPPDFVLQSVLDMLRPWTAIDWPPRPELESAVQFIEQGTAGMYTA